MLRITALFTAIISGAAPAKAQQQAVIKIDLSKPIERPAGNNIAWPGKTYATDHLGFFCRQEIKADKKLPMPVRFRMGSMQYTDWLESKPNTVRPEK